MKIVFFGTSDYCLPILEALSKNFDLKLVVTRPDKPVGRKKIPTPSATKLWAQKNNITVAAPSTLKKDTSDRSELEDKLKTFKPDLAVVSDYGLIIPEKIFNLPKFGTLNIHFSKLPDLRGPSPVQSTILRGDTKAWITIFKLENPPELAIKMDSGPILFQKDYPIRPDDTTQTLYTRLFVEAAKILPEQLNSYVASPNSLIPQDNTKASFCHFLTKEDGFIAWEELISGGQNIYNKYRAVTPWPGLWSLHPNHKRIIIRKCHLEDNNLVLDEVQFEGEKPKNFSANLIN